MQIKYVWVSDLFKPSHFNSYTVLFLIRRILQTHFGFWKKTCFSGFCFFWIWVSLNLQTQPLSLENSPNSTSECVYFMNFDFFRKNEFGDFELEFGENLQNQPLSLEKISKLNPWVWRILQTQKKIFWIWVWRILQTQHLRLENSPNSFWFLKKKHVFRDFVSFESEFR